MTKQAVTGVQMDSKPNPFTTVTPLSKALAMLLFITFPFVGFYLGLNIGYANPTFSRPHMDLIKTGYLLTAMVFIFLQGLLCDRWHGLEKQRERIRRVGEILLNSIGSIVGWVSGYYLIFYRLGGGLENFNPQITDLVIFLLAFYGMTGFLPHILMNKLQLGKT